jgi:dUTP pyrophosphatase
MDLVAATDGPLSISPGERAMVATGIAIALPKSYEAQVRPRSGLALKHGVTVLNATGTIDADYRGEIGVILINHGKKTFTIERGMRIAQIVFAKVYSADWEEITQLPKSVRAEGGFGSSGL